MNKIPSSRLPARQRGAILVTSLLLLLILTVLGISMMKMTNMQDRMAGNTRDMNLALQGAEAALRSGENEIRTLISEPGLLPLELGINCKLCDRGVVPVDIDDPAVFDFRANATEFGAAGSKQITELEEDPRYKVEHAAFVGDTPAGGTNDDGAGRDYFTISGQSVGASGQANTVLQSTYARRF